MRVGALEVKLSLPGVNSLKGKRRIVRSLKERVRNKFNVAVAEVDDHDVWRTTTLGIVTVANDSRFVESALSKALDYVRANPESDLVDFDLEVF